MITTFDLHDQAYYVWRDAAVARGVLVHVDAHHDAAPVPDWGAIDIGNYVRVAIRSGMIGAVRWVVPDPMWSDAATRRILVDELRAIADRAVDNLAAGAATAIEGVEIWMGPLEALPPLPPRVLLDIDVDYLLTARYEKKRTAEPLARPWCRPEDLVARLRAAGVVASVTTIAFSVTGGFTPLAWAHLARELAARLEGESSSAFLTCCAALMDAMDRRAAGNAAGALDACRAAVSACPFEPAAHFHLAEALLAAGQVDEARAAYRRARDLDLLYAHAFRTRGPYLYRRGRLREAKAAYRDALLLDPDDGHAQLGLAMVAMCQGRAADARRLAEASLAVNPDAVDAWRIAGKALARLGEPRAAIRAYQKALALSLQGATSVGGPWASNPGKRLIDPRHWRDHAAVGDLHAGEGDLDAAVAHYRIASAGAPRTRRLRVRLALLEGGRRLGRAFGGVLPS